MGKWYWWKNADRGNPNYSDKTLPLDRLVYHKSHVNRAKCIKSCIPIRCTEGTKVTGQYKQHIN